MTLDGETYLSKINPEMSVGSVKSLGETKKCSVLKQPETKKESLWNSQGR